VKGVNHHVPHIIVFAVNTWLFISPWNMLENWLMPQLNEDSNDYIFQQDGSLQRHGRVSQSKLATKVDRTQRKRRWRVYVVATPIHGFNPVWLFLLGGLWRTLSLCLHSPLISRFLQLYHRCCSCGRLWYADTMWNELDYRINVCRITKGGHIELLWNM